jgi:hypothetical protein
MIAKRKKKGRRGKENGEKIMERRVKNVTGETKRWSRCE